MLQCSSDAYLEPIPAVRRKEHGKLAYPSTSKGATSLVVERPTGPQFGGIPGVPVMVIRDQTADIPAIMRLDTTGRRT